MARVKKLECGLPHLSTRHPVILRLSTFTRRSAPRMYPPVFMTQIAQACVVPKAQGLKTTMA
jgi:hypothetical protein